MNMISSSIAIVVLLSLTGQSSSSVIPTSNLTSSLSYSDYLRTTNPQFTRPNSYSGYNYYYKILKLTVYTSGIYTLSSGSSSSVNMFGCLYETFFNPSYPTTNLLTYSDGSSSGGSFSMNYNLLNGNTYMFVVTTSSPNTVTGFTVTVSGAYVRTLESLTLTSRYGSLTTINPKFSRSGGYGSSYYYDSYDVTVSTSGTYSFTSSSTTGTDLYGCLYQGSFIASNPTWNMVVCDDDSAGSLQFLFRANLYASNRYILVVTTSASYQTGSYLVTMEGSSSLFLSITTPTVYRNFPVVAVVSGIFSLICFTIVVLIIVRVCRRRQQTLIYRTPYATPSSYNSFAITNKH